MTICAACADPKRLNTRVVWRSQAIQSWITGHLVRYCAACEKANDHYEPVINEQLVTVTMLSACNSMLVPHVTVGANAQKHNLDDLLDHAYVLRTGIELIRDLSSSGWILLTLGNWDLVLEDGTNDDLIGTDDDILMDPLGSKFSVIGIRAIGEEQFWIHKAEGEWSSVVQPESKIVATPPAADDAVTTFGNFVEVVQPIRYSRSSSCAQCGGPSIDLVTMRCRNPLCRLPALATPSRSA